MLNQVVIVGRLVEITEIKENEIGNKNCNIKLAVPRSYKNENGEYETDFIDCTLWQGIAENTLEYCHKGDVIGIKGKLQNKEDKLSVVAEKVSFLTSKKESEEN